MSGRDQAGVIPFRRKKSAIEICLIRNKGSRKWKIPKGFVDNGETAEEAALKEAWEEAGLTGKLVGSTIGAYQYKKWGVTLTVAMYLMEVSGQEDKWDESRFRERAWSPVVEAFENLEDHPVQPLLETAATRLERRRKPR
jgi:ADP-ribose pyrophosphatase YjhB (NUDIX family)